MGRTWFCFWVSSCLSYYLFEQDRPLLSGFVLGLAFIKPHLMFLIPLVLIIQRRWRILGGLALAGALEVVISVALGGFAGAQNYVRFLRVRQHDLSPTPERMMNVYAIARNLKIDSAAFNTALVLIVLGCVLAICWRGSWWQGFSAAIIGTLLIAPHTYLYDSTLVILPALLIVFQAQKVICPGGQRRAFVYSHPVPASIGGNAMDRGRRPGVAHG